MKSTSEAVIPKPVYDQIRTQDQSAGRPRFDNRIFGLLALILVAVGLLFVVDFYNSRHANLSRLQAVVSGFSDQVSERIQNHLDPVETQSNYLSAMIASGETNPDNGPRFLAHMTAALAGLRQVGEFAFIDPSGKVLRVKRKERQVTISDWSGDPGTQRIIATARQTKTPYWGEFFFAESTKSTLLNFRTPIWRGDQYLGVLVSVVSISELKKFLIETSIDYSQSSFILTGAAEVLAHSNPANLVGGTLRLSDEQPLPKIYQIGDPVLSKTWADPEGRVLLKNDEVGKIGRRVTVDGKTYILFSRMLKKYGEEPWLIGLHLPVSRIETRPTEVYLKRGFGMTLLLIIIIGSIFLGRSRQRDIA